MARNGNGRAPHRASDPTSDPSSCTVTVPDTSASAGSGYGLSEQPCQQSGGQPVFFYGGHPPHGKIVSFPLAGSVSAVELGLLTQTVLSVSRRGPTPLKPRFLLGGGHRMREHRREQRGVSERWNWARDAAQTCLRLQCALVFAHAQALR